MSDELVRVLLHLWMVSDPWPLSREAKEVFEAALQIECDKRGFECLVSAYQDFAPGTIDPPEGQGALSDER